MCVGGAGRVAQALSCTTCLCKISRREAVPLPPGASSWVSLCLSPSPSNLSSLALTAPAPHPPAVAASMLRVHKPILTCVTQRPHEPSFLSLCSLPHTPTGFSRKQPGKPLPVTENLTLLCLIPLGGSLLLSG